MINKNNIEISELNAPDDFKCIWKQTVNRSINASDKRNAVEKLFMCKENYIVNRE